MVAAKAGLYLCLFSKGHPLNARQITQCCYSHYFHYDFYLVVRFPAGLNLDDQGSWEINKVLLLLAYHPSGSFTANHFGSHTICIYLRNTSDRGNY